MGITKEQAEIIAQDFAKIIAGVLEKAEGFQPSQVEGLMGNISGGRIPSRSFFDAEGNRHYMNDVVRYHICEMVQAVTPEMSREERNSLQQDRDSYNLIEQF